MKRTRSGAGVAAVVSAPIPPKRGVGRPRSVPRPLSLLTEPVVTPVSIAPDFGSCLAEAESDDEEALGSQISPRGSQGMPRQIFLQRQLSCGMRQLEDEQWLSSSLMDLVLSRFARAYRKTHFMSVDFAVLSLRPSASCSELSELRDILGERLDYKDFAPIIFLYNANGIHWNLIRVVRRPSPQLQLFEPMGKPASRHGSGGLSLRTLPHGVVHWLDMCCPLKQGCSWLSASLSVITKQQQFNGVDCGVACLLYAEKAAQGQSADQISSHTSQEEMKLYRKTLQNFTRESNSSTHFDSPNTGGKRR